MIKREMRRKEKQMDDQAARELLKKGEYGILSTSGKDGYPYGVPVNYAYKEGYIYFHCAMDTGLKLEHMNWNDKVCFTVVGRTEVLAEKFSEKYESVIAFGRVKEVASDRKSEALSRLIEKYSKNFEEEGKRYIERAKAKTGVYKIRIEQLTGKRTL